MQAGMHAAQVAACVPSHQGGWGSPNTCILHAFVLLWVCLCVIDYVPALLDELQHVTVLSLHGRWCSSSGQ